jgi:hypothetical protein
MLQPEEGYAAEGRPQSERSMDDVALDCLMDAGIFGRLQNQMLPGCVQVTGGSVKIVVKLTKFQ